MNLKILICIFVDILSDILTDDSFVKEKNRNMALPHTVSLRFIFAYLTKKLIYQVKRPNSTTEKLLYHLIKNTF